MISPKGAGSVWPTETVPSQVGRSTFPDSLRIDGRSLNREQPVQFRQSAQSRGPRGLRYSTQVAGAPGADAGLSPEEGQGGAVAGQGAQQGAVGELLGRVHRRQQQVLPGPSPAWAPIRTSPQRTRSQMPCTQRQRVSGQERLVKRLAVPGAMHSL